MNEHVTKVVAERERQFALPGTESDYAKSPNDWIATILSIMGEGAERNGIPPSRHDFERAIVKSAAVCLAALEHLDHMTGRKELNEG